jgi:dUTP pyrophosphatase
MNNEQENEDLSLDEIIELLNKLKEETNAEIESDSELMRLMDSDPEKLDQEFYSYLNTKEIRVKKVNQDAILPSYNYPSDSGFDFYSTIEVEIPPFGRHLIPTGLSFRFDEGYEIQVRTKSGLAINQGIMVLNSPGTVDQGYSGEIKVPIFNANPHPIIIKKGMKIAQGVLCPVVNGKNVEFINVDELEETDRGDNGFGSTGI